MYDETARQRIGSVIACRSFKSSAMSYGSACRRDMRKRSQPGQTSGSVLSGQGTDHSHPSARLPLASGAARGRRMAFVDAAGRGKPGNQGRSTGSGLSEQLARREVSILKRLESGLSDKEIAEAIFVSESTLKWHLRNV